MRTYSRILGIVMVIVALLGLVGASVAFVESDKVEEYFLTILAWIVLYAFVHFLILNGFGFTYKANGNMSEKRFGFLFLTLAFIFFLIIPTGLIIYAAQQASKYEQLAIRGEDDAPQGINGKLNTKYVDGQLMYNLLITTTKGKFEPPERIYISFYDQDHFLIEEHELTSEGFPSANFSKLYDDKDRYFGLEVNGKIYMSLSDYKKIRDWELAVSVNDGIHSN